MIGKPPESIVTDEDLLDILAHPFDFEWHAHGIGMLRTYLDPATRHWRLNLWHSCLVNPGISTMHSHPWSFVSYCRAGMIANTRWHWSEAGVPSRVEPVLFNEGRIQCGPHFNGVEQGGIVSLEKGRQEVHTRGMIYRQRAEEIHDTQTTDGTITVIRRGEPVPDHSASVFWPVNTPWGDATRPTTREDVKLVCGEARHALSAEARIFG